MPSIPFPLSSTPGQKPGEGQGRLINVFAEKNGDQISHRRVAGLNLFTNTAKTTPRGMLDVSGNLFAAYSGSVVRVDAAGVVTTLTGTVAGSDLVTWARNNKAPTPDIVAVSHGNGAFSVTTSTVSSFADADLPQPNSVSFLDGFFLWTIGSGKIFASGLNDVTVNPLSFASCESNPDSLIRGTVSGGEFYAWGSASCEVWRNVGGTPFPLQRSAVIPVGLIGPSAIAGFETGWDLTQIFVAADGTVRQMNGYQPEKISTPDVDRAIQAIADKSTIRASVHVTDGHPMFSLTLGTLATWNYDASTGLWHERRSFGLDYWRAVTSSYFASKWIVADLNSGRLFEVSSTKSTEDGDYLVAIFESAPVKQFPTRVAVASAQFDFTVGQGDERSTDEAIIDPKVQIQWSHDGGGAWSNALERSLGRQGQFGTQVSVNRLGLSTHHGTRFRLSVADPVHCVLRGGTMDGEQRRA